MYFLNSYSSSANDHPLATDFSEVALQSLGTSKLPLSVLLRLSSLGTPNCLLSLEALLSLGLQNLTL